ncbi:MAG: alpha/beta hydrolase [Paracoccaceae bacterium]
MTSQTDFVSIGGQEFFVRRWGNPSNPPLLCLHGFPEYGGAWADIAPYLASHFHVIAPDQRGFGQSWAPPSVTAYKTSKLVADMAQLIDTMSPVTVFGHDWGAAVAYGLAMFRPDLVSRLIIANGVHPVPFQRALAAGGAQTAASQYIRWLQSEGSEAALEANNYDRLFKLFSANMDFSWLSQDRAAAYKTEWSRPGRLRGMVNWYRASPLIVPPIGKTTPMPDLPLDRLMVKCPHLLIWGEKDTALLPEATLNLEEFAPDLTRIGINTGDHWVLHQHPQDIALQVIDYCR